MFRLVVGSLVGSWLRLDSDRRNAHSGSVSQAAVHSVSQKFVGSLSGVFLFLQSLIRYVQPWDQDHQMALSIQQCWCISMMSVSFFWSWACEPDGLWILNPLFHNVTPTEKEKKRYRDSTPLSAFFSSMFNVRLVLLVVLLVHVQADSRNNNYIRGEKVNPASRIVNGKNHEAPEKNASNDLLEFQTVTRLPGSQPAQDGPRYKRAQWF